MLTLPNAKKREIRQRVYVIFFTGYEQRENVSGFIKHSPSDVGTMINPKKILRAANLNPQKDAERLQTSVREMWYAHPAEGAVLVHVSEPNKQTKTFNLQTFFTSESTPHATF